MSHSDFNAKIRSLYTDASGKGAELGTLETQDYSAQNQASLRPGGVAAAPNTRSDEAMADATEVAEEIEEGDEILDEGEQLELDISDTLGALFEGTDSSPEFVSKFKLIFETALNEKTSIMEEAILEASKEIIDEKVQSIVESLTEQMNDYLSYVVEEWMTENKLEVESGLKTELAENFIMGLKELFENSFIDIPQEKYDVLDELFTTNSNLESKANIILAENIDLKNRIVAHECVGAFVELSAGLADTEIERLAKLTENIDFSSVEQYTKKVQIIRESYFSNHGGNTTNMEETTNVNSKPVGSDPIMEAYARSISNQLKLK